jgi:hypothetical protein
MGCCEYGDERLGSGTMKLVIPLSIVYQKCSISCHYSWHRIKRFSLPCFVFIYNLGDT